jgi:hypothetical protein
MKLVIHEPEAGPTAVAEVEVLYGKNTENEFDTVTITSVETTSAGVPLIKVTHPR